MSASRFWARGRPQPQDGEMAGSGSLTAADRCDRCGARAFVRVLLPNRLELLFCAHHTRQHASALAKVALEIRDETEQLARCALGPVRAPRSMGPHILVSFLPTGQRCRLRLH